MVIISTEAIWPPTTFAVAVAGIDESPTILIIGKLFPFVYPEPGFRILIQFNVSVEPASGHVYESIQTPPINVCRGVNGDIPLRLKCTGIDLAYGIIAVDSTCVVELTWIGPPLIADVNPCVVITFTIADVSLVIEAWSELVITVSVGCPVQFSCQSFHWVPLPVPLTAATQADWLSVTMLIFGWDCVSGQTSLAGDNVICPKKLTTLKGLMLIISVAIVWFTRGASLYDIVTILSLIDNWLFVLFPGDDTKEPCDVST